jgi:hypothetical protein
MIELLAASRPASLQPPWQEVAEARAKAAAIAALDPGAYCMADRVSGARPPRKPTLLAAGVALTAVGTVAALVLSAVPAVRPPIGRRPHPQAVPHLTARQILLTAAAHVTGGPGRGTYWRVQMMGGVTVPGGTRAHPYDISLRTYADQWNPSSAGRRAWFISRQLGARPASSADVAAWRASGSPANWRSGQKPDSYLGGLPLQWVGPLVVGTAASVRGASWQVSDGTVGFIEGDLAGLSAAQFRRIRPGQVEAILRQYATRAHCRYSGCSTVDQLIWYEALFLLEDPVSAEVRSATFKVMAGLPGVRLIGPMTDPLGRAGYAIAPGRQDPNPAPGNFNPLDVILIDPQTGSLLATAELGPMPRTLHCLSFSIAERNERVPHWRPARSLRSRRPPARSLTSNGRCVGPSFIGRSYPGQIDEYVAVLSEGWTSASPHLPPPADRSANGCCAGLPPLP